MGDTTLTVAQIAAHGHTITLRDTGWGNQALVDAKSANRADAYKGELATSSVGSAASHTHSLTGSSGESGSLPPWYALAYVIRVA